MIPFDTNIQVILGWGSPVDWMIYSCGDPIGIVSRETKAVILLKALIGSDTEKQEILRVKIKIQMKAKFHS